MLTYTGILKVKNAEVKVSDRFRKREFVLTEKSSAYPQTVLFQLTQDRCPLLDTVNVGDEITAHFYLRGREWKNPQGEIKFFNSLDVFKIEKINTGDGTANAPETVAQQTAEQAGFTNETFVPTPEDDLPF
ncbi:MAG: DUF3127 domain-containing protein [Bacteroidota bacterium]